MYKVSYLINSGFAVKTAEHLLIFDYYDTKNTGGLKEGAIDTNEFIDEDVIVFISHNHPDHFCDGVFDWQLVKEDIRYVVSSDVPGYPPDAIVMEPDEKRVEKDFTVTSLLSTDEGVAFIVEIDGLVIYHAGDLNLWLWDDETDEFIKEQKRIFKSAMKKLREFEIDLAFIPLDPRLEKNYLETMDVMMKNLDIKRAVPMHFMEAEHVIDWMYNDARSFSYRNRIIKLTERGQEATVI